MKRWKFKKNKEEDEPSSLWLVNYSQRSEQARDTSSRSSTTVIVERRQSDWLCRVPTGKPRLGFPTVLFNGRHRDADCWGKLKQRRSILLQHRESWNVLRRLSAFRKTPHTPTVYPATLIFTFLQFSNMSADQLMACTVPGGPFCRLVEQKWRCRVNLVTRWFPSDRLIFYLPSPLSPVQTKQPRKLFKKKGTEFGEARFHSVDSPLNRIQRSNCSLHSPVPSLRLAILLITCLSRCRG